MSLVLIKTFLSIVETGSLVKASKQLNITQSTVTSRLKSLEDEIGQTLLHRKKSGMVLTSSGIKFKQYAEAISHMWQQAIMETSLPEGMQSICNLGCEPDLWSNLGRKLANTIRHDYSTTALTIRQGDAMQLDNLLGKGQIDAAISYRTTTLENASVHQLNSEKLSLYSTVKDSPMHHDPNYVYIDAGTEFGRKHAEAYADAGVAKNTIGSVIWGLEHLLDYGGSAYLPDRLVTEHIHNKLLFLIEEAPTFKRNVYLITNNSALKAWTWLPDILLEISNK